jgi:hypothetical protein
MPETPSSKTNKMLLRPEEQQVKLVARQTPLTRTTTPTQDLVEAKKHSFHLPQIYHIFLLHKVNYNLYFQLNKRP